MTEEVTKEEIAAVRAGCNEACIKIERHPACTYPDCTCRLTPVIVRAALAASQSRPTKGADITRAREQIVEECARVAERYNDGVGLATARGIARAIRALSPAPTQTEDKP